MMIATEPRRTRELAAFYGEHHRRVIRAVGRCAGRSSDALIADACAFAWLALVRRVDVTLDARGREWVITVAMRQAWHLGKVARREVAMGPFRSTLGPGELLEPEGLSSDPLDRVIALEEHAARLERFAGPKPRERRDLLLKAAGYRYAEIAALSRGVCVNVAALVGSDVDDMSPTEVAAARSRGDHLDSGCCFCVRLSRKSVATLSAKSARRQRPF